MVRDHIYIIYFIRYFSNKISNFNGLLDIVILTRLSKQYTVFKIELIDNNVSSRSSERHILKYFAGAERRKPAGFKQLLGSYIIEDGRPVPYGKTGRGKINCYLFIYLYYLFDRVIIVLLYL